MVTCPSGHVYRKSHFRRSPNGDTIKIKGTCVRKPSRSPKKYSVRRVSPKPSPRKSPKKNLPVRIKVHKGELGKYGYTSRASKSEREYALELAVEEYGWLSVFRKLNAIWILNRNRNPEIADVFLRDRDWVKKMFS